MKRYLVYTTDDLRLRPIDSTRFYIPAPLQNRPWTARVEKVGLRVPPCSDVIQRPLDHLNGAGLLWRISGGKITAMQSDWTTIEIDGVQRIIHRRPSPANFVLPWRRRAP